MKPNFDAVRVPSDVSCSDQYTSITHSYMHFEVVVLAAFIFRICGRELPQPPFRKWLHKSMHLHALRLLRPDWPSQTES